MNKELITQTKVTSDEYKKLRKVFPSAYLKQLLVASIIIFLFGCITIIPPDPMPILDTLFVDTILISLAALILKILDILLRRFNYKRYLNKNKGNADYNLAFHNDYLEKESNTESSKIKYTNIRQIKETSTNLYIYLNDKRVIIVTKENSSSKLIEFIKNISYDIKPNDKSSKKIINNKEITNIKEYTNTKKSKYKIVKAFLIILFILTIISLWIGLAIVQILMEIDKAPSLLFTDYTWGMYLCLPIPILSIILGLIYKNKGIKCTKNIVAGFIIGFLLLIFGSFTFIFDFHTEYNEVYTYKEIIGVNKLPSKGNYIKIEWDSSYLLNHTTHYICFADYNENEELNNDITINNNWLNEKDINTNLSSLIPVSLSCPSEHKCHYSVYIKELNKYNENPSETGIYHIYAMIFDYTVSSLQIEEYDYSYIK